MRIFVVTLYEGKAIYLVHETLKFLVGQCLDTFCYSITNFMAEEK